MAVLLHTPLATAIDTHHDARAEPSERVVLRAAAVSSSPAIDPPAGPDPIAIPACRVHVARPASTGSLPRPGPSAATWSASDLSRHKGQDLLVEALADLADRDWHCVLAGSLDRAPDFVEQLQTRSRASAMTTASGSPAS